MNIAGMWDDYHSLMAEWDASHAMAAQACAEGRALTGPELHRLNHLATRVGDMTILIRILLEAPSGDWCAVPSYERQAS